MNLHSPRKSISWFTTFSLCVTITCLAADKPATERVPKDLSLRNEIQHAIDKGTAWLLTVQNTNGWWSTADQPAITALALSALQGEPAARYKDAKETRKGYAFLVSCAKPDGSIYTKDLPNYNTSISMTALLSANRTEYDGILHKARAYLVGSQIDQGEKDKLDTPFDGGIGYGSKYQHSDLNNTLVALEALYYGKRLVEDRNLAQKEDLDWKAAIHFLQSCQNLPSHNKEKWASDDPQYKGGFIYYPGQSMAGSVTNKEGRVAFRSYGTASYAGLLSYIYADLKPGDPRVDEVMGWLRDNYTLEENPGMGSSGIYYYLHLMTKALTIAKVDNFETKNGGVNWRKEVVLKLINLQKSDGSWANENGRWLEKDPALVTAYSLMALEMIYRGI